ncbi:MAG: hypothetical protein K1X74_03050 [Pirellulales bacterium]|nr:hypothetical protein [Pirellulales bacterium]
MSRTHAPRCLPLVAFGLALLAALPSDTAGAADVDAAAEGYRKLAPGVLTTIAPQRQHEETFSRHDVVELLKVNPDYKWAKDVRFEHQIGDLEFSFKPVRFVEVDLPRRDGTQTTKLVWYLVYRVRNLNPQPVRFVPRFVLESVDQKKQYADRVIPAALEVIRRREDPRRPLLDSTRIIGEISPSTDQEDHSVWGVATWSDVDPRTDQFRVYVAGLSTAYRWEDTDQGRTFTHKTLQLNFWRPSDELHEHEAEIRLGLPGDVDYRWVYR